MAEAASDRINVLDEAGSTIGWVDPHSGARTLLVPGRGDDFDETVDSWLRAAGLTWDVNEGASAGGTSSRHGMSVVEVRYPDPEVVRSLLIPMVHLT